MHMSPRRITGFALIAAIGCHRGATATQGTIAEAANLSPGDASVAGKIIDATTHDPVQAAAIVLVPAGRYPAGLSGASGASDKLGEFILNSVPPGEYELRVSHTGYKEWKTRVRTGSSGSQRFAITLEKTPTPCGRPVLGTKPQACP